jgi:hypothetical protein
VGDAVDAEGANGGHDGTETEAGADTST